MKKTAIMYTDKQFEELENFTKENFGSHYDYVVHEITSEYVHTDTFLLKSLCGEKIFVTCGMGARQMKTPNGFSRCELVMKASKKIISTRHEGMILASELTRISKFPFRKDTWLGNGHTIDASEEFKAAFGYDYFAFMKLPISAELSGMKENIDFLLVVPIYEAEREWCVENYTLAFLEKLNEKYNGKEVYADFKREIFIPDNLDEEELADFGAMTALGINKQTLQKLCEYLELQEKSGVEITYDMLGEWVKENN